MITVEERGGKTRGRDGAEEERERKEKRAGEKNEGERRSAEEELGRVLKERRL